MFQSYFAGSHALAGALAMLPVLAVAWLFAVATHEAGHFCAAKCAGMNLLRVHVGPLELLRGRRRWRARFVRGKRADGFVTSIIGGKVMACPDLARSIKGQYLLFVAGGPAANVLCALVIMLIAHLFRSSSAYALLCAFAAFNLCVGLSNLVPMSRIAMSDGHLFVQWARRKDEEAPDAVVMKILALRLAAQSSGPAWDALLAKLPAMPHPMPFWHLYLRMKEAQSRGEWHVAAACNEQDVAMSEAEARAIPALLSMFRCEIAFSKAMAHGAYSGDIDAPLLADLDWSVPSMRPRCKALQAALDGNAPAMHQWLVVAALHAEESFDASLRMAEQKVHEDILGRYLMSYPA